MIRLPVFQYPIAGDTEVYLSLAENIKNNGAYEYNGVVHTKYPPLWPLTLTPFLSLTPNPVVAMRIASIIMSCLIIGLTYYISRLFSIRRKWSVIISLLVMFNPWFLYFTTVLPVSEGLACVLYLLGCIFFVRRDENCSFEYVSAGFFAIALISKVEMIFYLFPFSMYYAVTIFKRKTFKKPLTLLAIMAIPFLLWIARNLTYTSKLTGKGYDKALAFTISEIPVSFIRICLAIVLATTVILPLIVLGLKSLCKSSFREFWILFTAGLVIHLAFFVFSDTLYPDADFMSFTIMRTRRLIIGLPLLALAAWAGMNKLSSSIRKIARVILLFSVPLSFSLMLILNYGVIQEQTNKFVNIGETFPLRTHHRLKAISWINDNVPHNSILLGNFKEGMIYEYIETSFRNDISYVSVREHILSRVKKIPAFDHAYFISDDDLNSVKNDFFYLVEQQKFTKFRAPDIT